MAQPEPIDGDTGAAVVSSLPDPSYVAELCAVARAAGATSCEVGPGTVRIVLGPPPAEPAGETDPLAAQMTAANRSRARAEAEARRRTLACRSSSRRTWTADDILREHEARS